MRERHRIGLRRINIDSAYPMKKFAQLLFVMTIFAPVMCGAQVKEDRIKELAALHVGDYCHADVTCHYDVFPVRPGDRELVVQVTRSVDVAGWPLYPPGDISIQMRFSKSGKFLSKKTISADSQPPLQ